MTCEQFETLMHFYLDNELSSAMKSAFEKHLSECKLCREKYDTFKTIITQLRESYKKIKNSNPAVKLQNSEQQMINTSISAYIDNELDLNENVKIKKMIISKPDIRNKIEKINSLKVLLKESFRKTQPTQDYSKQLLRKIYSTNKREHNKEIVLTIVSFIVLSIIWIVMLVSAISI